MGDHFFLTGEAVREPFHYKGCGLEGIYLLNGYTFHDYDGERHVSISDIPGLHQAIGRYLVACRKGLSPKEIKFLRNTMGITQAELAARLGNNAQSVARWEKGQTEIQGTEEKLLRAVFLASLVRDEDLTTLRDLLDKRLMELDEVDELKAHPVQFELFERWEEKQAA